MSDSYMDQARLLLQVLPLILKYARFSLKGGTALNFFIHEFPRLSVDIDLAYTKIDSREEALSYISDSMEDLTRQVNRRFTGSQVQQKRIDGGHVRGLVIRSDKAVIKVEPNLLALWLKY